MRILRLDDERDQRAYAGLGGCEYTLRERERRGAKGKKKERDGEAKG
jgi:hypothetical protein